jgi:hypothetical protein
LNPTTSFFTTSRFRLNGGDVFEQIPSLTLLPLTQGEYIGQEEVTKK